MFMYIKLNRVITSLIVFLIALTFLLSTGRAQTDSIGWELQNPKPTGNHLRDISAIDQDKAIAIGDKGTILITTDGGEKWRDKLPSLKTDLHNLFFVNDSIGWAGGENGLILRTLDGGKTWDKMSLPTNEKVNDLYAANAAEVWIAGSDENLFHTSDSGQTWRDQIFGNSQEIAALDFIGPDTGWAIIHATSLNDENGELLRTTNGGLLWETLEYGNYSGVGELEFNKFQFGWQVVGMLGFGIVGVISGNDSKATDKIDGSDLDELYDVHSLDTNNAWAVGNDGEFIFTDDGGQTWDYQSFVSTSARLNAVHFTDQNHGWVVGNNGRIFHTTDGGNNWERLHEGTQQPLKNIFFTDSVNGWAVGENSNDKALILHTSDGGKNWAIQRGGGFKALNDVYFVNPNTGWATGDGGAILHTEDGGQNWTSQKSWLSGGWPLTLDFMDENNGWVVGNQETYQTSNGGQTWNEEDMEGDFPRLYAVDFLNMDTGWIAGYNSRVAITNDGGKNWIDRGIDSTGIDCVGIQFINAYEGWAVTAEDGFGEIFHTVNGGKTWEEQKAFDDTMLFDIHFVTQETGWAVGGSGTVLHTSNGGENWQIIKTPIDRALEGMHFYNANLGWVAGEGGNILQFRDNKLLSINLTEPENNTKAVSQQPIFEWDATQTDHHYRLQLSPELHFDTLIMDKRDLIKTAFEFNNQLDEGETYYWRVKAYDSDKAISTWSKPYRFRTEGGESGLENPEKGGALSSNYPNPFTNKTRIQYSVAKQAEVSLVLYNNQGKRIRTLVEQSHEPGKYTVTLNGGDLSNGTYYFRLKVDNKSRDTQRVIKIQ